MKTYAAYYDNKLRIDSSSGGIFSLIAKKFDIIYGVAMTTDNYGCEFVRTEKRRISTLRGSKYIQAKVGKSFKQVKQDLIAGKNVLFTGTGCQINGLAMFLGKDFPNLFLMDVICHGTPSPKLWREYAQYQEKKYGKLETVSFRCKDDCWKDFGMKENEVFIPMEKDSFMLMFLKNYSLRPACYECHAKYYKKSDMSIADFWGIENIAPELNDGMGTSAIFVRTEKGQRLFDLIKGDLKWKEVPYESAVKNNPCEYESVARPIQRDTFFEDMNKMSFRKLKNKYLEGPLWKRVGRKIKYIVKKWGGEVIKRRSNADYGMLFTFKK